MNIISNVFNRSISSKKNFCHLQRSRKRARLSRDQATTASSVALTVSLNDLSLKPQNFKSNRKLSYIATLFTELFFTSFESCK